MTNHSNDHEACASPRNMKGNLVGATPSSRRGRRSHNNFQSNPITDHLDLWTSAMLNKSTTGRGSNGKQEAYGIKKLRELILELAVRGKLVPQDPKDEPANILLNKIAEKKAFLMANGELKHQPK